MFAADVLFFLLLSWTAGRFWTAEQVFSMLSQQTVSSDPDVETPPPQQVKQVLEESAARLLFNLLSGWFECRRLQLEVLTVETLFGSTRWQAKTADCCCLLISSLVTATEKIRIRDQAMRVRIRLS